MTDRDPSLPSRQADSSASPPGCDPQRATRHAPLPSEDLLRGRRMVEIAHNGEVYRLQATRLGKLILTK
jgi:hemin uptake protein HemP